MKEAVNTITLLIQLIIGIGILNGKADLRTLAWYWVITGIMGIVLLAFAGLVLLIRKDYT